MRELILASSSKYRQALLKRLQIPFTSKSPRIDELQHSEESPHELVKRLSISKAEVIARENQNAIVIGSDQVAIFNGSVIGKPEFFEKAVEQLTLFSGNKIQFITGVSIQCKELAKLAYDYSEVTVLFKTLTIKQIKDYLLIDEPYDCAGSFKIESLGITLFESVLSDDPTSLEGLPLITLCHLLSDFGFSQFIS